MDVADPDQCTALARAAMVEFGRIDVLVNNAGLGIAVPAVREKPEEFRRVLDVNLMGAYWMAQACARLMLPGSSIVNVASTLALIAPPAPQAAYAASKAGLIGLTRDLSAQWAGRRGIRVNAVAPGYVATEMTAEVPREMLDGFIGARSPLNMDGGAARARRRRRVPGQLGLELHHREHACGRRRHVGALRNERDDESRTEE
jgi:NAD(P)-dependent dehydrogenase (short-subunit alcohol dehydrogenase family)